MIDAPASELPRHEIRAGKRGRLLKWAMLTLLAAVLTAGLIAPLVNANRFRARIQNALETALNRKVSIQKEIRFNLFTGPGFTVNDVLIRQAEGEGLEPLAHVESMEARVRLASLWTGHLAFSNLRLIEPSLNFVKSDAGGWNVAPLLSRAAAVNAGPRALLPDISISSGRLNFTFGDTKSVFYIDNADMEIYPDSRGRIVLRFEGEPARTDHPAQALGRMVARGVIGALASGKEDLNLSVQLERTSIPELLHLFGIEDPGVRGFIASNIKLDGPVARPYISGDLRIEDIHRWDLMPNKGEGWTLNYTGFLDLAAQQLDIETRSGDQQTSPIDGKFVASDYLTSPRWQASLRFHDLPAAGLVDTARHMGAPFPAGATLDAKLNGEIGYARPGGVRGELVLNNASFKFPQGGVMEFAAAPLTIDGQDVRVGPAEIRAGEEQSANLDLHYSLRTHALVLGLDTKQMGLAESKALVTRLLGAESVPLLDLCQKGFWKGALAFERKGDAPGEWTGELELQNTQIDVPGIAAPVRVLSAAVQLQPQQFQMTRLHGREGNIAFEGDYRYQAGRSGRIRLVFGKLDLAELEQALAPSLRRQQGFFERALRLQRAPRMPDWLSQVDLEGSIQVKDLRSGDLPLGTTKAGLIWSGAAAQLTKVELKHDDTSVSGSLAVNLEGPQPRYRFDGQVEGLDYRNGTLDVDGVFETAGTGSDLAVNLHSDGTFQGAGITLGPDAQMDDVSGEYRLEAASGGPRLLLTKVQLTQGQDVLRGQGTSQADGHLVLELASGRRQVRLTGMLLPLQPPAAPAP